MAEKTAKRPDFWTKEERENTKDNYSCEILISNGSFEQVRTREVPTDACIIQYMVDNTDCYDLARGTRVKLFDMYYDKFNNVKAMDYGQGTIKPSLWRYASEAAPKKKKRK